MKVEQKYTSAATSVKKKTTRLSTILAKYYAKSGDVVLDYGGGKYDTATEFLAKSGIVNIIYDPFNRSEEENLKAMEKDNYDFVMVSNVLNVIAEKVVRLLLLEKAKKHLKVGGALMVKVYEGDRSGCLKVNEKRNSCQVNQKIGFYFWEVAAVFGEGNTVYRTHDGTKIIVAYKK